jgi:TolA-binding protein
VRVPVPDEAQLARVARRIVAEVERRQARFGIGRWRLAGLLALLGSAVTAGAEAVHYMKMVRRAQTTVVAPPPARPHPVPLPLAEPPPSEPELAMPEPEPPPPARVVAHPHPVARPPEPPVVPDPLSDEAQLLHSALEKLSLRGDAVGALALLDTYRARYPNGVLSREANVARLDALLRVGNRGEALAVLDRAAEIDFNGYPRAGHLRVLRAELLAQSGRCREAEPIFTAALNQPQAGQSNEQALFGRASCRASLGNVAGSRSDLNEYLKTYPQGQFAREARQALER